MLFVIVVVRSYTGDTELCVRSDVQCRLPVSSMSAALAAPTTFWCIDGTPRRMEWPACLLAGWKDSGLVERSYHIMADEGTSWADRICSTADKEQELR